jgi:hypothetical protein
VKLLVDLRQAAAIGLLAVGLHVAHDYAVPPYQRQEHIPEQEPVSPTGVGVTIINTVMSGWSGTMSGQPNVFMGEVR